MYRLNSFRARGDLFFYLRNVEIVSNRIDIDEDRRRTEPRDRTDGCEEAVRRRNDLIAGADAMRHEGEQYRIASRGTTDRMLRAAVSRQVLFELRNLAAKDKSVTVENTAERVFDLWAKRRILFFQIKQGNLHFLELNLT